MVWVTAGGVGSRGKRSSDHHPRNGGLLVCVEELGRETGPLPAYAPRFFWSVTTPAIAVNVCFEGCDMTAEKFDFAEVLAVLEAKYAALGALIGSYRAALSLGALGQPGDVDMTTILSEGSGLKTPALGGPPIELPAGAFLNTILRMF